MTIELEVKQIGNSNWYVGCQIGKAYIATSDNTLPKAIGHLKDRIAALKGMRYGIDYTFKDKMV